MESSQIQNDKSDDYPYTVIFFESENLTELVPSSWVYEKEGQCFCYFPPSDEFDDVGEWTAKCAPPKENWESFIATVLSRTKTLGKGKKRLKRSFKTNQVESTDDEAQLQRQVQPTVSSRSTVKAILKKVPSMPTIQENKKTQELKTKDDSRPVKTPIHPVADDIDEISTGTVTERVFNKKMDEMMESFQKSLTSLKRSMQYDMEAKVQEIKNTILANANNGKTPSLIAADAEAGIGVALPIEDLQIFQEFDGSLPTDPERRNALMSLYYILICGETTTKSCLAKIMPATMTKTVQLNYSGTGRKINGIGKLDFSKTHVFRCIKDSIVRKFGDTKESESLAGKVGKWLSGAGDRDGGRKAREKPDENH